MKLTVLQENLSAATAAAARVATNNPYLIMASMVLLETVGDDTLQVTATNGNDTVVLCVTAVLVEEGGGVCAPAKKLHEIVRLLPGGGIALEVIGDKHDVLMLTAPNNVTRLNGHPPQALTSIILQPEDAQPLMTLTYGHLRYINSAVGSAAAKDDAREALTGVLFDSDGRQLKVMATNGVRLALHQARVTADKWRLLLPVKSLATFLSTANHLTEDDPVDIAANDAWAVFSAPGVQFTMQRIGAQYPAVDSILERKQKVTLSMDGPGFMRALATVAKQDGAQLRFSEPEDGLLELSLELKDSGGSIRSVVEMTRSGGDGEILFAVAPGYFMDCVRAIPDTAAGIAIDLENANSPLKVRGAHDGDNLSVVMPMIGGRS
jgi:DNA polymerase-3 subunit beta